MIDTILQHVESIMIAVVSAGGAAWGALRWRWSYVDSRITRNSDATDANAEEITVLRMRTTRNDDQINGLQTRIDRFMEQSSQERKELRKEQATKSDMESMREDVREIREILIQRNGKP